MPFLPPNQQRQSTEGKQLDMGKRNKQHWHVGNSSIAILTAEISKYQRKFQELPTITEAQ